MRDAFFPFDATALRDIDPTRSRIALMRPSDFLRLAAPIAARIDTAGRAASVRRAHSRGMPFSSLPELVLDVDGGAAYVVAHDGRHRARRLLEAGAGAMPVVLSLEPADLDGFPEIGFIHPQPHDDDDDYPGWSDDDLNERQVPVRFETAVLALYRIEEAMEMVGVDAGESGPATGGLTR